MAVPSGAEVRVCTNRTCRRDGSYDTARQFEAMVPRGVHVNRCGCLGRCGNGPNVVVLPSTAQYERCASARSVAAVVHDSFGGAKASILEGVWNMRELGNDAGEKGNWKDAITCYDAAIQAMQEEGSEQMLHVVHSNRSTGHLALGNTEESLHDARRAVEIAPEWHKGYLKLAQAHIDRGEWEAAAEACNKAYSLESKLMKSPVFKKMVDEVRSALATAA